MEKLTRPSRTKQAADNDAAGKPETTAPLCLVHNERHDEAVLDEFEQLAKDCLIRESDDSDDPERRTKKVIAIEKQPPRFANFRSNPATILKLWGTTHQDGMDTIVYVTTPAFAPNFEGDVELKQVLFYETVTAKDGVVRLVYCFLPRTGTRRPNMWVTSKKEALELSLTKWTTMRTLTKEQRYAYRQSRKDYGEPRFSGLTKGQLLGQLRDQGLLVLDKDHDFFKEATDTEDADE